MLDVAGAARASSFNSSMFANPSGSVTVGSAPGASPGNSGSSLFLAAGAGNGTGAGGSIILTPGTGGTAGGVGIGTTTPSNILTVAQNSGTKPIADAWTVYSSRRFKTDIETLEGALQKVLRLRGVSFDWKEGGRHDIGLIAEEVGTVVPEVVAYEPNGTDARSVDYARLVALLIEALKEQQKEIDALQASVTALSGPR